MKTDMAGGAAVLAAVDAAARLELPVRGDGRGPGGGERRLRVLLPAGRRRPARRRADHRGAQHRRRGPDGPGRRPRLRPAGARRDGAGRRRHPHRRDEGGAGRPDRGAVRHHRRSRRRAAHRRRARRGSRCGGCRCSRSTATCWTAPSPTPTTRPATRAATTAALFLQPFAGDLPWAHLDVAGPARAGSDDAEVVKGGTGFGARTLLRWLEAGAPVEQAETVLDWGGGPVRLLAAVPSIASRSRSACPACRAVSSIMWSSTQRRSHVLPVPRGVPTDSWSRLAVPAPPPPGCAAQASA